MFCFWIAKFGVLSVNYDIWKVNHEDKFEWMGANKF